MLCTVDDICTVVFHSVILNSVSTGNGGWGTGDGRLIGRWDHGRQKIRYLFWEIFASVNHLDNFNGLMVFNHLPQLLPHNTGSQHNFACDCEYLRNAYS